MIRQHRKEEKTHLRIPFITIPLLIIFIFNGVPFINTLISGFTDWNGYSQKHYVGLKNFQVVLHSELFWKLTLNTLEILLYVPLTMFLSFILSCFMVKHNRIKRLLMYIIYLPQIISTVVISKGFNVIFGFDGPVNDLLKALNYKPVDFLGNSSYALAITIISIIWYELGWHTLTILGGFSNIDENKYQFFLILTILINIYQ